MAVVKVPQATISRIVCLISSRNSYKDSTTSKGMVIGRNFTSRISIFIDIVILEATVPAEAARCHRSVSVKFQVELLYNLNIM